MEKLGMGELNFLAIAVAGFAYFMLGAVWFSPFIAGSYYDKALGFTRTKDMKWGVIYYIGPFMGCIISTFATAILIQWCSITSVTDAVKLGLLVGVGYGMVISITNAINPNTPRPLMYGLATGGYHVIGNILASVLMYMI